MFVYRWFMNTSSEQATNIEKINNDETVTIKREEFNALIARLNNLETLLTALPQSKTQPISINATPTSTPLSSASSTPKEHKLNPFQLELENRLSKLRERLGQSHGFGSFPLNNVNDLQNLERSIMEMDKEIVRPKTPCPDNQK